MKVLIMSDSHGLTHEISIIKERHKHEVSAMIHCGDSELDKKDHSMNGLIAVRGNCDRDPNYPNTVVETFANLRFLITHGHLFNVKMTLLNLSLKAEEEAADIICFGHSHSAGSELIEGKLYINPGSISEPRGRKEKTYVILDIVQNKINVTFYDLQGKMVEPLSTSYQMA